jgi:16S rRNA (adenine1518-N6/adenine1519-N6)-dimethyltransferase
MQPKKSLGQHFLRSRAVLNKIIAAAHIAPSEYVLEVGPGKGVLTAALLEAGARVTAVEKDRGLIPLLREKFAAEINSGMLTLIEGDILNILKETPETLNCAARNGHCTPYALVANIPYYITGALLRSVLSATCQPNRAVLLLQKEVAERIVAKNGKESVLSLSVKAYGAPRIVARVPATAFAPPPKVDSAILAIDTISRDFFDDIDEKAFFELIKDGFSAKRKMVRNALAGHLEEDAEIEKILAWANIPSDARAERLTITGWHKIVCASLAHSE